MPTNLLYLKMNTFHPSSDLRGFPICLDTELRKTMTNA